MFAEFTHHRASWKDFPQHFHPRQRNDYLAERQVTCQTCSFDKKYLLFTPLTVFTGDFKSLQITCFFCCENWVLNSCWVWFYNQDLSNLVLQHLVLLNIVGFTYCPRYTHTHTRFNISDSISLTKCGNMSRNRRLCRSHSNLMNATQSNFFPLLFFIKAVWRAPVPFHLQGEGVAVHVQTLPVAARWEAEHERKRLH